ncbi:MAG: hypothetical protein ACK587_07520 [Cyanobacteriota bacterium]
MRIANLILSEVSKNSVRCTKRAAHFLLIPELLYSPPNDAIIRSYLENDYSVDVYAPGLQNQRTNYGFQVKTFSVNYTWAWLFKNLISLKWLSYNWISGTSEDPLAVVAVLSRLYGKKSFALVDEIKSGSYRGDRSKQWKAICKWGIRQASFSIVNDEHRVELLKNYAALDKFNKIIIYPGCYNQRPVPLKNKIDLRKEWGFQKDSFVIGSSGGFNLTAGADWLLNSIRDIKDIYAVIQPLGVSDLSFFLLENLDYSNRIYIQKKRLGWHEAWKDAIGFDIGLSIYTNPAPQFQAMGISSNRLCMFIAMGIPVIASKQKSFDFLEKYQCGILVESFFDFKMAIKEIRGMHSTMASNCEKCFRDYIRSNERFHTLLDSINNSKRGAI